MHHSTPHDLNEVGKVERWYERALVMASSSTPTSVTSSPSPKLAHRHRVVGCLEQQEAITRTPECLLKDLEAGKIDDVPAPAVAMGYGRLPADATLKDDAVTVVRDDEAHQQRETATSTTLCRYELVLPDLKVRTSVSCLNSLEMLRESVAVPDEKRFKRRNPKQSTELATQ